MRFRKIWGESVPGTGEGTARPKNKLGHWRSSKEARVAETVSEGAGRGLRSGVGELTCTALKAEVRGWLFS